MGYITRGRGVTIHKADCVNAQNGEPERRVHVSWAEESSGQFEASIQVIAYDHVSLLGELAMYIGELNVPIRAVSAKVDDKKGISVIGMTLSVSSREQVDRVIRQLQKRQDIIEVYQIGGVKSMRCVVQRVKEAAVTVAGEVTGKIGPGLYDPHWCAGGRHGEGSALHGGKSPAPAHL